MTNRINYIRIFFSLALFTMLSSCMPAHYATSRVIYDDMYGTHNTQAIAAQVAKENQEAALVAQMRANAEQEYINSMATSSSLQTLLEDDYQGAYERRLRGFDSPTYNMPSSYYDYRYSSVYNSAMAYDPAFYNVMVMGDQVWVEPKYITSLFGTWGLSSAVSLSFGLPYYAWNAPYYGWSNSYYNNWGWNYPYWNRPHWYYSHYHPHYNRPNHSHRPSYKPSHKPNVTVRPGYTNYGGSSYGSGASYYRQPSSYSTGQSSSTSRDQSSSSSQYRTRDSKSSSSSSSSGSSSSSRGSSTKSSGSSFPSSNSTYTPSSPSTPASNSNYGGGSSNSSGSSRGR